MKNSLGNVVWVVLGALVVYSCAGKSISRTEGTAGDDDPPPTADDGFTGGLPGVGGSGIGATPGTTGNGGTTTGKGGRGGTAGTGARGGTTGKGGSPGTGGRGGTAGTSGVGGTSGIGGDDGTAGDGTCEPDPPVGVYDAPCNESKGCVSWLRSTAVFIRRNAPAAQPPPSDGGAGGEGGASGDPREDMASAWVCEAEGANAFLAFDYFSPADPRQPNWVLLVSGTDVCGGGVIGRASFLDFTAPAPGTWTTQCLEVMRSEIMDAVSIDVPPAARVRNLRMVTRCECPRALTRYTTCGPLTSSYCQ